MKENNQSLTDILKLAYHNNDLDVAQNYLDKAIEKKLPYAQMVCYVRKNYVNYLLRGKNEK
jgi:hypothetical protein